MIEAPAALLGVVMTAEAAPIVTRISVGEITSMSGVDNWCSLTGWGLRTFTPTQLLAVRIYASTGLDCIVVGLKATSAARTRRSIVCTRPVFGSLSFCASCANVSGARPRAGAA